MTRTRSITVSLTGAAMFILAGCNSSSADQASTPAPTTNTGTTTQLSPDRPADTSQPPRDDHQTTTTPPERSAGERDEADVKETLVAYNKALNRARIGEDSIEEIYPYSRDTAREQWVTQLMAYEAQGITITGLPVMELLEISVDGDTAEAVACVDVTQVEAVDANGDSVITEERLDQTLKDYVLERDQSAEAGWYVVEDVNRSEPCVG